MQSISAEGANHWRVESRFQPRKLSGLPQADVKRAPLALSRCHFAKSALPQQIVRLVTQFTVHNPRRRCERMWLDFVCTEDVQHFHPRAL